MKIFCRCCRIAFLLILGVFSGLDSAKGQSEPTGQFRRQENLPAPHHEVYDVQSQAGSTYRIFIARPAGKAPQAGFPVIYILDGNAYFPLAVELYRLQARHPQPYGMNQAVLVGIGYPTDQPLDRERRVFDLTTPASPEKLPSRRGGTLWSASGGAETFRKFIESELKPWVEQQSTINKQQEAIFGHSLGGYFVMNTLFTQPDSFNYYLAASPSGWWNDYELLQQEQAFFGSQAAGSQPRRLLLTVGELELSQDAGPAAQLPQTSASQAFGSTREFAGRLKQQYSADFMFEYHEYAGENHGSVIPQALNQALRFVLLPQSSLSSPQHSPAATPPAH